MAKSIKKIEGEESAHYVSLRRKRAQPEVKMQPPLTPVIDVTFQLLIFFLVTFQIRQPEGLIPASLPQLGPGGTPSPLRPIRIELRAGSGPTEEAFYEIGTVVTADIGEVYDALVAQRKAFEIPVEIRPKGNVKWRFVVEAFNVAVRAKFKRVAFASSVRT